MYRVAVNKDKTLSAVELCNDIADKCYCGGPNSKLLNISNIGDGIMRKNQINAVLTEYEIRRNKMISKVIYKIEQYFEITEKYHEAVKARFTAIIKENWDHLSRAMAFNIKRVTQTKRKQEIMAAV